MLRFPPRKILVPFDLSDISMNAWLLARQLAHKFSASLELVYVEPWLPAAELMPPRQLTPKMKKEILDHIRRKVGTEPKVDVLEGEPVVAILRLARTHRPDLIVMGTHGRTGFDRMWLGSVTEAVVRLSPAPVLTVRDKPRAIRSVLAPVNFTDYSDYGFVYAAAAAAALKARLTPLHVYDDPYDHPNPDLELSRIINRLPDSARHPGIADVVAKQGKPTEEILRAAARHDLVVMVAHRKSLLKDMVLGTTAERVLRYCPVPVLSVPAPKEHFSPERLALEGKQRAPMTKM